MQSLTLNQTIIKTAFLLFCIIMLKNASSQEYKFDFGNSSVAEGYIGISSNTQFSSTLGYGIDSGSASSVSRSDADALHQDFLTTDDELFFSVSLPQGNYDVTVIFGDVSGSSATTIKTENRRLLFDRVHTESGTVINKIITVRRMEVKSIDGSVTMSIKNRERGYFTWDNMLTLRISGKKPAVCGIEITKNDNAVTLYLCGNSTVVDQLVSPWCGWGQMIPHFFKPGVVVANYAESGLTSGNFLSMKRLAKLLTEVKQGDYVFVEFGHNDQKSNTDVANYSKNLTTFCNQITARKAIPVLVTPTARQNENDPLTSIGGLAQKMRETATTLEVTCIDLNKMVIDIKRALGSNTKYIYMHTEGDQTHFSEYGGYELARAMLKGLEEKIPSLKNRYIEGYTTFDLGNPDPLNYLEQELPPVSIRCKGGQLPDCERSGLSVCGNLIPDHSINPKLPIYCINGKKIANENIELNGNGYIDPNTLARLPTGIYILMGSRKNNFTFQKLLPIPIDKK